MKVYINGDKNLYVQGLLGWGRVNVDDKHYKEYLYYRSRANNEFNALIVQRYGFDAEYGKTKPTEEYKRLEAEWEKELDEIEKSMPGEVFER